MREIAQILNFKLKQYQVTHKNKIEIWHHVGAHLKQKKIDEKVDTRKNIYYNSMLGGKIETYR